MKKIVLHSLILRNFKGVEYHNITFSGNTNIYGANESGKSTIASAFYWCLTGKDEFDRKDFQIKNSVKKHLNDQAHEVEIIFGVGDEIGSSSYKIKRVYKEVWTKPKGQPEKVFSGHTTDFFVNDVPYSEKEYNAKIAEIIPLDLIKLLTNPLYFNSQNWNWQRSELIKIAGEITDAQVFKTIITPANDYSNLIMVLNTGKKIEEYKKELASKKLLLKKAAVEYEPRIDEATRNMPKVDDWAGITAEIKEKLARVESIEATLESASKAAAEANKSLIEKQQFIYKRERALADIKNSIRIEQEKKKNAGASEIAAAEQNVTLCGQRVQQLEAADRATKETIDRLQAQIKPLEDRVLILRGQWKEENGKEFSMPAGECVCFACKREFDVNDIESKEQELRKNFNDAKARKLAELVNQSTGVKQKIQSLNDEIFINENTSNSEAIQQEKEKMVAFQQKVKDLKEANSERQNIDIDSVVEKLLSINEDALYLIDEIKELKEALANEETTPANSDNEQLKAEKSALNNEILGLRARIAVRETIESTQKRINDLKTEESANAQAIADIEKQEFELETYTRAKMDILEKKVNQMFQFVSFRLFDRQVNGGIAETCTCQYKGVDYATLNTAAKMLAGLDVINTLSKFYGIAAPVFCDNRESVTIIPDIESQVISLYVSPDDKQLRIGDALPPRQSRKALAHEIEPA